ncbi:hypothetical protein FJY69_03805, partial [candidate division WOR-3 bacterium]|nr:hypothetical protein [candidate division WOR-3 bacterium]
EFPGARPGTAVPYVDESGATAAWVFHFRTDGGQFPDYDRVADDVRAQRQTLMPGTDLTRWTSPYCYVMVSARYDRPPVYRFGYGSSEYYALARPALDEARAMLGVDARLSRVYFIWPSTYLEFGNGVGQHVVFSEHAGQVWRSRAAFSGYVAAARAELVRQYPLDEQAVGECHRRRWDKVLAGSGPRCDAVFVPDVNRAPFYDWSYGCTPTSGAIVLGYLDRTRDYGRLVDWYAQRRDNVENEQDWQIPNVQRECALAMYTDTSYGGTYLPYIAPGLATVGADNGYSFEVTDIMGAEWNDWAWDTITAQIDSGRPMVWSATWERHSLACFGYRTEDQYLYVHNTWWQPAAWWSHSGPDWAHVAAVNPSSGDPHQLHLVYPRGDTNYNSNGRGEVVYVGDTCHVTWNNHGNPGTAVDIYLSRNGGRDWQQLADNAPDNGSYAWYVPEAPTNSDTNRLRLEQYSGATYTAGDGSFGNFRLQREPMPPTHLAPPNGLAIQNPPVVLVVDSTRARCDSVEFKLILGVDTIWRQLGTAWRCPLPDTLFERNRTYKWMTRSHNRFGWGSWAGAWSFRVTFGGVEETVGRPQAGAIRFPAMVRLSNGAVLRLTGPGVEAAVFDALGNLVRTLRPAKTGERSWDLRDECGRQVQAGLYFVRLGSGATAQTRKLVLVN